MSGSLALCPSIVELSVDKGIICQLFQQRIISSIFVVLDQAELWSADEGVGETKPCNVGCLLAILPIGSMYGIYIYLRLADFYVNVGKYAIHGSYGYP